MASAIPRLRLASGAVAVTAARWGKGGEELACRLVEADAAWGERVTWKAAHPQFKTSRVIVLWLVAAAALMIAAAIVPGVSIDGFWGALMVALLIGLLNATVSPLVASVPLPYMLVTGLVVMLFLDAALLVLASGITNDVLSGRAITVDSFWWALLAALGTSAVLLSRDF